MAPRRSTTLYLWELAWILPSIALPVGMLAALAVTAFGAGINVAGDLGRIDSTKVAEHALFKEPGLVQIAPGQYEVHLTRRSGRSRRTRSACRRARRCTSGRPARTSCTGS